jgi:hypothetical protein
MPNEIAVLRAALRIDPEHHARLRELARSGKIKPGLDDVPPDEVVTVVATPNHCGIEGSRQDRCGCGTLVWIAPSTQAMLIKRGTSPHRVICGLCFLKELEQAHAQARPQ